MTGAEWAVPYVPCGCGPVLRAQACGDYTPPYRWWKPPRYGKCGHVDVPCHHVKVMEAFKVILGEPVELEDIYKTFNDAWLSDKMTWFDRR